MMAQWAHPEGLLAKAGLGRACCPQRAATIQTAFNLCGVCGFYRRAGDSTPYLSAFIPSARQSLAATIFRNPLALGKRLAPWSARVRSSDSVVLRDGRKMAALFVGISWCRQIFGGRRRRQPEILAMVHLESFAAPDSFNPGFECCRLHRSRDSTLARKTSGPHLEEQSSRSFLAGRRTGSSFYESVPFPVQRSPSDSIRIFGGI